MRPKILADLFTTRDVAERSRVGVVERILDDSGIGIVSKMGINDPPEKKCSQFKGGLTQIVEDSTDGGDLWIFTSGQSTKFSFSMTFTLRREGVRIPLSGFDQGFSSIIFSLETSEFTEWLLNELKSLLLKLAVATDAFYGRVDLSTMYGQRNEFMRVSAKSFLPHVFPDFNRELPDVYWLNYFGLGYVDHWGREKVEALGREYELDWDEKGGVCVVTTPCPISADLDIGGITDYPFKKHFYHVLGGNTFVHETQKPGQAGQYVPTLEDHRRIAGAIEKAQ